MRFAVISSGSKANCTFIEGGKTRLLIDCGLSLRETERRLVSCGVDPATITAIVITHEHSDHIAGVARFARRHKVPVYANELTAEFLQPLERLEYFKTGSDFVIGDLDIHAFSIVHDAADPVGFSCRSHGLHFAQATDLGRVTQSVKAALSGAHALVLESNHDEDMLRACDYPWELKQRILSSHGHLSNDTAGNLLRELMHGDLQHVVLGHLSENSNTPHMALQTVESYLPARWEFSLQCGSVAQSTEMLRIGEFLPKTAGPAVYNQAI